MNIKETKSYSVMFTKEDAKLIDALVREQVGSRTIASILDEFSYVFECYRSLFNLISKVYNVGSYATLTYDETRSLVSLLSNAYNDGKHEDKKEQIKGICDAIDTIRKW